MWKLISGLLCFTFVSVASAKTVIVSDIDDTIRSLHSRANYLELLDNASDPYRAFRGMSEIYNSLDASGAEIHYVTAAVEPFIGMSLDFLSVNQFPQPDNYVYKGWWEDTLDFKVARISEILDQAQADVIILLGDNGDRDVDAYAEVAARYPSAQVFIHKLYPEPLALGQVAYLTAADLAVTFESRGLLKSEAVRSVLKNILRDLSSNDEFVLDMIWPYWGKTTGAEVDGVFGVGSLSTENQKDLGDIKAAIFP